MCKKLIASYLIKNINVLSKKRWHFATVLSKKSFATQAKV